MASSADNTDGRVQINAYNNVEKINFEYQITFDKISARTDEQQYNTDVFTPPGKYEPKLFITLKNTMNPNDSTFDTKLGLHVKNSKNPVNVLTKISILNEKSDHLLSQENKFSLTMEGNPSQPEHCIYSVPKTTIQDQSQNLLFEDKLTYICEFSMDIEYNTETERILNGPAEKLDETRPFVKDFETLFETKKFSDLDLKFGEREFKVHKGILAARSPYFHDYFYNNLEWIGQDLNLTGDIQISGEIFEMLLEYIYTNKIPSMDKNASQLLAGADKLELKSLKSICEQAMCAQLSPETMYLTLMDADKYKALDLKAKTVDYIDKHASVTEVLAALYANKQLNC